MSLLYYSTARLFVHLFICLFVCLFIYLFIYLFVCFFPSFSVLFLSLFLHLSLSLLYTRNHLFWKSKSNLPTDISEVTPSSEEFFDNFPAKKFFYFKWFHRSEIFFQKKYMVETMKRNDTKYVNFWYNSKQILIFNLIFLFTSLIWKNKILKNLNLANLPPNFSFSSFEFWSNDSI